MKLTIIRRPEYTEPEVTLKYADDDPETTRLIDVLNSYCKSITAVKGNNVQNLDIHKIYYFESVDDKTYIYTKDDVYDCKQKLYEIEDAFRDSSFIRISKSCIVNIAKLKSVRPFMNGKFEATMQNGEKMIINRHYVADFKKKFGI